MYRSEAALRRRIASELDSGATSRATVGRLWRDADPQTRERWARTYLEGQVDSEARTRAALAEARAFEQRRRAEREQQEVSDLDRERQRLEAMSPEERSEEDEHQLWLIEDNRRRYQRRQERNRAALEAWREQLPEGARRYYEQVTEENQQLEADLWQSQENYKASVRLEVTAELLGTEIALGDGSVVTWGTASAEQLRQRAAMLMAMAKGDVQAAARLIKGAETVEGAGVTCLNDLEHRAA